MPVEPTLAEIIRRAIDSRLLDVHVSCIARVEKFTPGPPGPPVVDVVPVIRRALVDTKGATAHEDLPVIPNVPVIYPRGTGDVYSITWPLAVGDHVSLVFNTCSFSQWRETGEISDPGDLRLHSLGNPVAIPGVGPKSSQLPVDATAMVIEGTEVKVGPAASDFVAMNQKVLDEIAAVHASVKAHIHNDSLAAPTTTAMWVPPTGEYVASADVASTKLKAED